MSRAPWIGLLLLALVACKKGEADWKKVRAGMTEDEVTDILGKPSKKKKAKKSASVAGAMKSSGTEWRYGEGSFVVFAGGTVSVVTFEGKTLITAPTGGGGGLRSGSIGD